MPNGNVLFSGTTEECFADLLQRVQTTQARRDLANLLSVSYSGTFCVWVKSGLKAVGTNLVRVRILLEQLGYTVNEWEKLPMLFHYLAESIAFDVLTVDEAREGLNYKTPQEILRLILRYSGAMPDREALAKQFVGSLEGDIVRSRMNYRARLQMSHSDIVRLLSTSNESSDDIVVHTHALSTPAFSNDVCMQMFASQVAALQPLARYLVSDQVTPSERKKLRTDIVGYEAMSELSNLIDSLTSETTREKLHNPKNKRRVV